ncbi:hypothetical protein MalM25_05970 [Planctomycetes bacterium MalM25]|nr:hypothetical protein MalM25_05970 [Planctomycetes bacterium MalM25]
MPSIKTWSLIAAMLLLGAAARTSLLSYASGEPAVLGETAVITEVNSGVEFTARVDTGAAVSSIHVEPQDVVIEDESPKPDENIDKRVLLKLENHEGEEAWVETRIEDYVEVRNAERAEHRYRVKLPLQCGEVQKFAMVNLNDRSTMTFRLLLGRDFLRDDFIVDVARSGPQPL